jgi:glycosidase
MDIDVFGLEIINLERLRKAMRVLAIIVALTFAACTMPKDKIPDQMPADDQPPKKVIIYQMMTRLFGNTNTTNKKYGTIEENGVGKFKDVSEAALRGIKELGVTHVWFTGVIEHALLTDYSAYGIPADDADVVKGRAGSPYAIKDYYDINPDLATDVKQRMAEFEALVDRTHGEDLKVIIDFVPNHVARSYRSDAKPSGVKDLGEDDDKTMTFKPQNNFYYLPGQSFQPPRSEHTVFNLDGKFEENPAKVTGNNQFTASPSINDWYETVKLNYGVDIQGKDSAYFDPVPDTWKKMLDILVFWANKKVDGFRCDMAEMVPVEFWNWVIPQVKAVNSNIIFIAEVYNPKQYSNYIRQGGFDFLYDKVELYDFIRLGLINPKNNVTLHIDSIKQSHISQGISDQMLHFLENHDEQRFASRFFAGDAWKAVPAMAVSALIDRAPMMIYFGQEVGEPGAGAEGFSGEDGRTTMFDYWGVPEHQKWVNGGNYDGGQLSDEQKQLRQFYTDILTFARDNKAIVQGTYHDLTKHNAKAGSISGNIATFVRHHEDERIIVVASFADRSEHVKIQIPASVVQSLNLKENNTYIGRDLLRSGVDIGLDAQFTFEVDVPAYSAYIFKVK